MIAWLLVPFAITLIGGVPISFCLILGVVAFLTMANTVSPDILAQQMYQAAASFPLMAIPFFLLAGDLMERTGITHRLVKFLVIIVGRIRGGLAQVVILSGTMLAGLSGSGAADTAAMAKILVPGMKEEGYDVDFSAALTAATGVLGPIIPPSIVMIVYGSLMNVSVGKLFIAGIIPGLLLGIGLMVTAYVISIKNKYPKREEPFSWKELFIGLKDASLALVMPVIILVGIRGGIFTPTEGGAAAVAYALFLGFFIYRSLSFKMLVDALVSSGVMAAVIMLIVAAANPFGWLLSLNQVPQQVAGLMLSITSNKYVIMMLINILLLIMGMFMETNAIVLLLAPILAPIAIKVGVDPLHFGVIMVVNLCIGLVTPPVGLNLFVAASTSGITLERVSVAVIPFLLVELGILLMITYIPEIILFFPRMLGM
ncbi:MAG: C4-dicarboxylate ABC transporter permease [Peptococcaceae bacterium BICA1-8]|nr:MAG: C4-dicarboxylate ABC transporter permease [Peptococcaceae bacterium BICA1-8]